MQFAFDLISDLHLDTWHSNFDWSGQATSAHCVVAGDICFDQDRLVQCLMHLSKCYQAVFYIDGNGEHEHRLDDLDHSYSLLAKNISKLRNVVYLQDNVVVINGVAILGTYGWWNFDFDPGVSAEHSMAWFEQKYSLSRDQVLKIRTAANTDATYLLNSVRRLQTHQDVKKIVMVTHTVPREDLISHDIELAGSFKFNTMGNSVMKQIGMVDTQKKIHTWCFGHYHGKVDQVRQGIRFVNNCRGRGQTRYSQWAYYPLRILVDI